jgi:hypothetical protein
MIEERIDYRAIRRIPPLSNEQQAKFWSRVEVKGPDDCWPWLGKPGEGGYGNFVIAYRAYRAHRIALAITKGLPSGLWSCHHCDNPCCCNPNHLYPGTCLDNVHDAIRRKYHYIPRNPRPETAKVVDSKWVEIARRFQKIFADMPNSSSWGWTPNRSSPGSKPSARPWH